MTRCLPPAVRESPEQVALLLSTAGKPGADRAGARAPDFGGLRRLGRAVLEQAREFGAQQLGRAGEGGVQRAERLEHKDDVGDLEQACAGAGVRTDEVSSTTPHHKSSAARY